MRKIMQNRRGVTAVAAALALSTSLVAAPADASVINTRLERVRTGFQSQRVNHVGAHAVQAGLIDCTSNAPGATPYLELMLKEVRRLQPDVNMGLRNVSNCFKKPYRASWGFPGHAKYYWQVKSRDYQTTSARIMNLYF